MSIRSSFLTLFSCLSLFACSPQQDTDTAAATAELQTQLTQAQAEIATLKANQPVQVGLVHSVFFWLKDNLTTEQETAFRAGVASLRGVGSVQQMYIGTVAPTEERGVIDNTYSIALLVHFADVAGQNAYQIDPIHLKFVEDHKDKWTKVVVYDSMVE
jgi:hypothetical protein